MRRLVTPGEFTRLAPSEQTDPQTSVATTSVSAPEFGESGRIIRYTFSTPAVGRDLHTVAADAWQVNNFKRNPVFLFAHDDTQPPIGRVVQIGNVGDVLKGNVEYAERDLSPFADTIYRLVRAGYLSAVSTSWQPLEWNFSRDKKRPGGVDFSKVDLLEISQVPIPALPSALAEARSHGIDTTPIRQWAERLLDSGGLCVVPRSELETLRRAATARPLAKSSARSRSIDREKRVRIARELARSEQMTDEDERRYQRYRLLRDQFSFSVEQAALDIGCDAVILRAIIARGLSHAGDSLMTSTALLSESRKFSAKDKERLRSTERYIAKGQRQHADLEEHHDSLGERIRDGHTAYRALTSTLKGLGERSARTTGTLAALGFDHHETTRALKTLGDSLDAMTTAHGDAADVAFQARHCLNQAANNLNGMIGSGSDEDELH